MCDGLELGTFATGKAAGTEGVVTLGDAGSVATGAGDGDAGGTMGFATTLGLDSAAPLCARGNAR